LIVTVCVAIVIIAVMSYFLTRNNQQLTNARRELSLLKPYITPTEEVPLDDDEPSEKPLPHAIDEIDSSDDESDYESEQKYESESESELEEPGEAEAESEAEAEVEAEAEAEAEVENEPQQGPPPVPMTRKRRRRGAN
jgi:hypothetical protein